MFDVLSKLCRERELAAIYSDRDDCDRFSVGYILNIDHSRILIEHIGPNGVFDGYSIINSDYIFRIETESAYLDKIRTLNKLKNEKMHGSPLKSSENLLIDFIDHIIANGIFVKMSIDLDSLDIKGYIDEKSGDILTIRQVSDYGNYDGKTFISIDDIERISIEDSECTDLALLFRNK